MKSDDLDIWSQPRSVLLYEIIKPDPPKLTVVNFTQNSVVLSWRSRSGGICRLRYRVNNTQRWSQTPDLKSGNKQEQVYTIEDLLPFTSYIAAVTCREKSGFWSDWSSNINVTTLESVPSKSPQVCYRLEYTDSGEPFLLHLMWKALDLYDAGSRVLSYQVSYRSVIERSTSVTIIKNVTEVVVPLEVEEGNWSVTVTAFNAVGYGPSAHLNIATQRQKSRVPSVRNMWVSSTFPAVNGLRVEWKVAVDQPSALPVSHFDVQWRAETHPSTSCWSTVDGSNTSAFIPDVEPGESYLISVFPIYEQQFGSPQSLNASLQQGALMEVDQLKVFGVNKTAVSVVWAWQKKSGLIRVNGYSVMLQGDSEKHTLFLWPDQLQHTFLNLTPNTEYSLILLADDVSRITIPVRTDFDEVPVVATATPLLLLAVTVLIVSILSRTVYKRYFFPPISSPRNSTTGKWLMDSNRKSSTEQHILDIKDFQETDICGVKNAIVVAPRLTDLHEDTALLSFGHFAVKLSDVKLETQYVSNSPLPTEHQLQCYLPEVFESDKHHQTRHANIWFPQKEEEDRRHLDCQTSQQGSDVVKCCFHELMANADDCCVSQITCEPEYVMNASYLRKSETDCSLICETDYIPNIAVVT
ncbi:interleukin-6 receptor subunit beta isoform X2 [Anabas testudineus]|nr:interleukin-6 receptor subunit beta isoform X2 [Anabas testudineus]